MIQHIPIKSDMSNFKHDFFSSLDTPEKCYWLGYIASDGNIKKDSNHISFCLGLADEEQIGKFANILGFLPHKRYYWYPNTNYSVQWAFASKQMKSDLIRHGVVPAKSLILRLPNIENRQLMLAFLLGYYDGDGVTGTPTICSGSIEFLMDIKNHFNIEKSIKNRGTCSELSVGRELLFEAMMTYPPFLEKKESEDGKLLSKLRK